MKIRAIHIALLGAMAMGVPAFAMKAAAAPAPATPQMGEVVRDQNGALSPNFRAQHFCDQQGNCHDVVIDLRTHAPVGFDGKWTGVLKETGNGQEVVRSQAFSDAERPKPFDPAKAMKAGDLQRIQQAPTQPKP